MTATMKMRVQGEYIDIPYSKILAPDDNVRQELVEIDELAASILQVGLLQPPEVRPVGAKFELVAGFRRHAALGKLIQDKLWTGNIPVVVRERDDTQRLIAQLVENLQRVDLNPIDEAFGMQALAIAHSYTPDQIATATSRSLTHVKERLMLCTLPDDTIQMVRDGRMTIQVGVALAVAPAAVIKKLGSIPGATFGMVRAAIDSDKTTKLLSQIKEHLREAGVTNKFLDASSEYSPPKGLTRLGAEYISSIKQLKEFLAQFTIGKANDVFLGQAYQQRVRVALYAPKSAEEIALEDEPVTITKQLESAPSMSAELKAWFDAADQVLTAKEDYVARRDRANEAADIAFATSLTPKTVGAAAITYLAERFAATVQRQMGWEGGHPRGARMLRLAGFDNEVDDMLAQPKEHWWEFVSANATTMSRAAAAFLLIDRLAFLDEQSEYRTQHSIPLEHFILPSPPQELDTMMGDDVDEDSDETWQDIIGDHEDLVNLLNDVKNNMKRSHV